MDYRKLIRDYRKYLLVSQKKQLDKSVIGVNKLLGKVAFLNITDRNAAFKEVKNVAQQV